MSHFDAFTHDHPHANPSAPARLRTQWGAQVDPDNVLPEYPRPLMVRDAWVNLNGKWDFSITDDTVGAPDGWSGEIVVPFAVESQLSEVTRAVGPDQRLWYRRSFVTPPAPRGWRWLLHFGAVDWEAIVHVNGIAVGEHRGGYDPFTFDVTDALGDADLHEVVVGVWDPTDRGPQPRGKQVLSPEGIWYTAVTGIWQTVWLEPVPPAYLTALHATADIDAGTVTVHVSMEGGDDTYRVSVAVSDGGVVVAEGSGKAAVPLTLQVPDAHLWSPSDPYLYDLRVTLSGGDEVTGYFGMRKIAVGTDDEGQQRLFLNNEPLFQHGVLDQGMWPDGLYTAPTDEALRFDIEAMKRLGFNMIRKHGKVEPARWYAHADRLGMIVWQDMPSGSNDQPERRAEYRVELAAIVNALRGHPSIVMWIPFNEAWGQFDTDEHVAWLRDHDPTRLVNNASGWNDIGVGDIADVHVYPGPSMPVPDGERALVLGEYGGLGLPVAGHTWVERNNWSYRSFGTPEELGLAYRSLIGHLRYLIRDGLSASVYTQATDVEHEVNGVLSYDRAVLKLPGDAVAATAELWKAPPAVREIMPTSIRHPQGWRYSLEPPPAAWYGPEFDDRSWSVGCAGFGRPGIPGGVVRTQWATNDLWLRRTFDLGTRSVVAPHWHIHHDDHADIYLNGTLVASFVGGTTGYVRSAFDGRARAALRPGVNVVAVHVRRREESAFGPYIDLGIDDLTGEPGAE